MHIVYLVSFYKKHLTRTKNTCNIIRRIANNMKKYTPKSIIKILLKEGWIEGRVRGSHHIFTKQEEKNIVVIPTSRRILPIGTFKNIEKQSGLKF